MKCPRCESDMELKFDPYGKRRPIWVCDHCGRIETGDQLVMDNQTENNNITNITTQTQLEYAELTTFARLAFNINLQRS